MVLVIITGWRKILQNKFENKLFPYNLFENKLKYNSFSSNLFFKPNKSKYIAIL